MDLRVRNGDGKVICELNRYLVEEKKLTEEQVDKIKNLHVAQAAHVEHMQRLDPKKDIESLRKCLEVWRFNEFSIQEAWGFPRNPDFHREYMLPHCRCPKMDNEDMWGTEYRIKRDDCPLHGKDLK